MTRTKLGFSCSLTLNSPKVTDIRLHCFIVSHDWLFPPPTSNALMAIFHEILLEIQPCYDFDDELVWTLEDDGAFSLKSAYRLLTSHPLQNLRWPFLIWFQGCIRKYFLCAWMFFQGKLNTKDVLLARNVECDSCCVLCDCTWESGSHLMLQCSYSQSI